MTIFDNYLRTQVSAYDKMFENERIKLQTIEYFNSLHYLTFEMFNKLFKKYFGLKNEATKELIKYLYVFFCFGSKEKGIILLSTNLKYSKEITSFLSIFELKGFINTPADYQKVTYNQMFEEYKANAYIGVDNYLFNNYITKGLNIKVIEDLASEHKFIMHYGNKVDIVSYFLDLMITNSLDYKLFATTCIDIDDLELRYSKEQIKNLQNTNLFIYLKDISKLKFTGNIEYYNKENFINKGIKYGFK